MWINVILTTDSRIEDAARCIISLREIYGPCSAPVAIASYGDLCEQTETKKMAEFEKFEYIRVPPFKYLTDEDRQEWHTIESLARVYITR